MNDLRRELGARDLTLFAIASIVGVRWIAAAARAGPGSILLWLLAALLFMMPLSIAVAVLTARDPCAGGMYHWTRRDFGPWHGFLCFWTYWIGMAFWFPSAAMFYMSATVYVMGPHFQWLADNRAYLVVSSLCAIWIALGTNIVGMKIGKWTENTGAVAVWILALLLGLAAWAIWTRRGPATQFHLMPDLSWCTINFWAANGDLNTFMKAVAITLGEMEDQ